jgi:uncharacterized protein (DUF488 family)
LTEKQTNYTIGHSNLDLNSFIKLLKDNAIEVLVDVRSNPYSRFASQFNKANIQKAIQENGLKYLFLGKELGGRPKEKEFYDSEGLILYLKIAESPIFKEGIERLIAGTRKYRVAIMCSEENPVNCHRRFLVGRALSEKGIQIFHIRRGGKIQTENEVNQETNWGKKKIANKSSSISSVFQLIFKITLVQKRILKNLAFFRS